MKRTFAVPAFILVFAFAGSVTLAAQSERILYRFGVSATDGDYPSALVRDAVGNLYGTTALGGMFNQGTVFELVRPTQTGRWTEKILYNFTGNADGGGPSTGLIFDAAGNLYGATFYGGSGADYYTGGVVFQLSPPAVNGGAWTETVLFDFGIQNWAAGNNPWGNLVFDKAGNLYGIASAGGSGQASSCGDTGCGVVFQMKPPSVSGGAWTYSDIHDFLVSVGDGYTPIGIAIYPDGSVMGTTRNFVSSQQVYFAGGVFQLVPPTTTDGTWAENILYTFTGNLGNGHGEFPSGLTIGNKGVLLGTTLTGGANNNGIVFQLTPPTIGVNWIESTLYSFTGGADGSEPRGTVTLDSRGTLYATASRGGSFPCTSNGGVGCGAVIELSRIATGWSEKTLYDFAGGQDGFLPASNVLLMNGLIFGTTQLGGSATGNGAGTVFRIKP